MAHVGSDEDLTDAVLIVGGGIGGLTAALALDRLGVPWRVFERVPELEEVGAGVGIWMNAMRVLDELGVGEEIRARGVPLNVMEICSSGGELLSRLQLEEVVAGDGCVNYIVHRARLHAALAGRLPGSYVRTGSECVDLVQDAEGVTIELADGRRVRGGLVIGADGIHSRVRSSLWGEEPVRYSGQTCFRGIARLRLPDPQVLREVQGAGRRAAVCPIDSDHVYWWAAINAPAGEADDPSSRRSYLLDRYRGWHYRIEEAIRATEGAILRNDLIDRAPRGRWSRGRATLLGDAAHPMVPNLGQGACTAIEDALVLARAIYTHGCKPAALAAYERARIPRTTRIVRESWKFGIPARWEARWAVRLREALIRSTPRRMLARSIRRHIAYDVSPSAMAIERGSDTASRA